MCYLNFAPEKFCSSHYLVRVRDFIIDFLFFHFDNEMFCGLFRQIQKMFPRVERVRAKARKELRTRLNWSLLTRKKAFALI